MSIIGFKGLGKMIKGLADMGKNSQSKVAKVVKVNTSEMQRNAMRTVPADTGFLKRSITLELKDMGLTGIVEPYANYASYVEYGTRFMDAQPYIRPNYEKQVDKFIKDMEKFVK